jgi:hypothetical protein
VVNKLASVAVSKVSDQLLLSVLPLEALDDVLLLVLLLALEVLLAALLAALLLTLLAALELLLDEALLYTESRFVPAVLNKPIFPGPLLARMVA